VVLAKTIKGYGLGEHGEGRNVTHKQKELNEEELREFRARFGIPISDEDLPKAPFYRPPDESPEIQYLHERRQSLGGYVPQRRGECTPLRTPAEAVFEEFYRGTDERAVSTTMVYVRLLSKLLRDKDIGNSLCLSCR
jgi:pyruvate dehydrogenase E1 component